MNPQRILHAPFLPKNRCSTAYALLHSPSVLKHVPRRLPTPRPRLNSRHLSTSVDRTVQSQQESRSFDNALSRTAAEDFSKNPLPDPLDDLTGLLTILENTCHIVEPHLIDIELNRKIVRRYEDFLEKSLHSSNDPAIQKAMDQMSAVDAVVQAFEILLLCDFGRDELSRKVRSWEQALGVLKRTPLTDNLSHVLLKANAFSGNVGRVISILDLRKQHNYVPRQTEFIYAIQSIEVAQDPFHRNVHMTEADLGPIDNPTRWLDAIVLNMRARDFELGIEYANLMLQCYAGGWTRRSRHFFWKLKQHQVRNLPDEQVPEDTTGMPARHIWYVNAGEMRRIPLKVKIRHNRTRPPFYKVPTDYRNQMIRKNTDYERPNGITRLELEKDLDFSLALTAAFAFADSLQLGACGHKPLEFNRATYNTLLRVCVRRGATSRAMHLIDDVMRNHPHEDVRPNVSTYNILFEALAKLGDVGMIQEYFGRMIHDGIQPDLYTVKFIVEGLLNLDDCSGAVTVVQDFFNQYNVLPPYRVHLRIFEFCLGKDLTFEAVRFDWYLLQASV
jgi:pentatricopeptide repeat protein